MLKGSTDLLEYLLPLVESTGDGLLPWTYVGRRLGGTALAPLSSAEAEDFIQKGLQFFGGRNDTENQGIFIVCYPI